MDSQSPITLLPRHAVCTGCGYSLAGLRLESSCPECNASCEDALLEDSIYLAKPQYIARMWQGIRLVILSIVLFVLMNAIGYLMTTARPGTGSGSQEIIRIAWYVTSIFTTTLTTLGWFWATRMDPSVSPRHPSLRVAKLLWITVLVMAMIMLIRMTVLRGSGLTMGPLVQYLVFTLPLVCYMLLSVRFVQLFARRCPGPFLKKGTKRAFFLMLLLCFGFACSFALWYIDIFAGTGNMFDVLFYTYLGSLLAMYTLLLWILWRFASILKSVQATALTLPPAEPSA